MYDNVFLGLDFTADYHGGPYPCLPSGSFTIKVSNGESLLPGVSERNDFIRSHYGTINWDNAIGLAQFLADSVPMRIRRNFFNHAVVASYDRFVSGSKSAHTLNYQTLSRIRHMLIIPKVLRNGQWDAVVFPTVFGWMHKKSDVYINRVRIASDAGIIFCQSIRVARGIYTSFPSICY